MAKTYGVEEMQRIKHLSIVKGNNYTIEEIEKVIEECQLFIEQKG